MHRLFHVPVFAVLLLSVLSLAGCQGNLSARMAAARATADAQSTPIQAEDGQSHHGESISAADSRPELTMPSPIPLDSSRGQEIGTVFEAFLSPHQEGGEEEDTPSAVPAVFKSTAPSVQRSERPSRGHGVLSFTKDLSKAYVHIAIENVDPAEIAMFHIHCGRPGQLGPILVDFALAGNLQHYWADNVLTLEITNEDIEAVTNNASGLVGAFTAGCPITPAIPMDKVKTIAGMETIAREGELYFNLHTNGQMFFGDIRGQLHQVDVPNGD